jgi:hypothetical protein
VAGKKIDEVSVCCGLCNLYGSLLLLCYTVYVCFLAALVAWCLFLAVSSCWREVWLVLTTLVMLC